MPRTWLSVPLGRTGIRIGRSIADAELRPHLPNWKRYEIRHALQAAAKARGETLTKEDADYCLDKALATGALDSAGNPTIHVKGTRGEVIAQLMEGAAAWGMPMTQEQAEAKVDKATPKSSPAWLWPCLGGMMGAAFAARMLGWM